MSDAFYARSSREGHRFDRSPVGWYSPIPRSASGITTMPTHPTNPASAVAAPAMRKIPMTGVADRRRTMGAIRRRPRPAGEFVLRTFRPDHP
ncbi:hypothetical protein [Haladaptatus salinisoli]|uniref:hypothetical protein n=1 Tax=Haladaptatus salinisoli TaxID=2884876 RepID=UPI001D0B18B4|nr:hypothetical protein [Haladaptatus salinisoli]